MMELEGRQASLDFSNHPLSFGVIGHLQGQVLALEGRSNMLTHLERGLSRHKSLRSK